MTDYEDRCGWSDLPVSSCGHCTGATGVPIAPEVRPPDPRPARRVWPPTAPVRTARDWHEAPRPPKEASPCKARVGGYYLPEHLPTCRDRECPGCKPCTHDQAGNPVDHCTARDHCSEHLDRSHPLTCPRCIARVRGNLAEIEHLTSLMLPEAIITGLDSDAAVIAGPAAHPGGVDAMRVYVRGHVEHWMTAGRIDDHDAARILADLPLDDDRHPYTLLARWELHLRAHYGHPAPRWHAPGQPHHGHEKPVTLASAVSYLSWLLTDLAQDPDGEFAKFATEVRGCRAHLENVLANSHAPVRGAPCPECPIPAPKLQLRRAHWCDDEDCTREHDLTGARDTWVCPANPDKHWWQEATYRLRVEDEYLDSAEALTASDMQRRYGIPPGTLRRWAHEGKVKRAGRDGSGRLMYDVAQARERHAQQQQEDTGT